MLKGYRKQYSEYLLVCMSALSKTEAWQKLKSPELLLSTASPHDVSLLGILFSHDDTSEHTDMCRSADLSV